MRRHWLAFACALGVPMVTGAAYWAIDDYRYRTERQIARREVVVGRHAEARSRWARLAAWRPGDGEVQFQLGLCESELGRLDKALEAWARVPADSPFAGRAAVHRAREELRYHRFAPAEELMARALGDRGPHAIEALETIVHLFKIQGRFEEARRLIRDSWSRYPDRIGVLKELAQVDSQNPYSLGLARAALERAARSAPDDDRIWLGWANLATRTGQFQDAARWLDRCERKRPDDPAVWRARLNLAVAAQDTAVAAQALRRLPADAVAPAVVLALRAWFASQAGDVAQERRVLADLVALEPANLKALERLTELELRAGDAEKAARLRDRKARLDRAKAEYQVLLFLPNASAHAVRLARLAEAIDRPLEARILWALALGQHPGDPEAKVALDRIKRTAPRAAPPRATLRDLLADLVAGPSPSRRSPAPGPGGAPHRFVDEAEAVGLRFTFDKGASPLRQLPETMSGGLGLLDYDGDGWLDVYCVQGGPFPPDAQRPSAGDRLYHNRGDGTFEDATESTGIAAMARGYGHGVAVGDYDNDGHPDLFVTRWRAYALYHNRGDGRFDDVTESAGLGGDRDWPTSAAFADLDGDGDLDLYVCHYLSWDSDHPQPCRDPKKQAYVYCGPTRFPSVPDHVFRNDGGRFVDLTSDAGIVDPHGQGLGVVACDFDGDGRVDLFVANDQTANYLYRNLGDFHFEEVGEASGVASSADGLYQASMGVACGDPDGDGLPDLAVTNFYNEGTTLYHNLGGGIFSDHTTATGLMVATRYMLGFGIAFLDADADGFLDITATNGHVDDFRPDEPYMMTAQLLAGTPDGRWVDVSAGAGPPWKVPRLGRGLAVGDLDHDGRVDLLILSQDQPLAYFHNRTAGGHWLVIQLEGTRSNRDAVGARVTVTAGGRRQTAWRFGGGSYQSASSPRLHFGLGAADAAEELEVTWPSGTVERFGRLAADAGYRLREGEGVPKPLAGYAR